MNVGGVYNIIDIHEKQQLSKEISQRNTSGYR